MDKIYDKPTVTRIVFCSEEKITEVIALPGIQAFSTDGSTDLGPDVSIGTGNGKEDWVD